MKLSVFSSLQLYHGTKHDFNAFKPQLAAFGKGVLIAKDTNEFKEDSYYVSAPVDINGRENIITVTVHVDGNMSRMYLHGVMIKEGLMKPRVSATLENKSRTHYGSLTSSDIHNILHDHLTQS